MPDNYATMTAEEQKFFDTQGAEAPAVETTVEEAPKTEPAPKQEKKPVLTTKKAAKETKKAAPVEEDKTEEVEAPAETVAPVKDPRDEQIENLNKALREERMATKERDRLTNERIKLIQEAVLQSRQPPQQQQPQQEVIPDAEKDPLGTLKYLLEQQRRGNQAQQLTEQQVQQQHQNQRIMNEAGRMEMEWLQNQEDYDPSINPQTGMPKGSQTYNEASTFLVNMRRAELLATGAYSPAQAQQVIANEAIELARTALQNGRNPAQVIMDIAKVRGFKPVSKQPVAEKQIPVETEQEKITRIAKAQEAGFSLSQASGGKAPNNSKLDAKTLANMPEEEFAAFMEKAKKSDIRALFGD